MKIKDVIKIIEDWVPLAYQEDYDNSGLIVGDEDTDLTGILICLDITADVLNEAGQKSANLIICHHPLIFSSLKSLTPKSPTGRLVMDAIRKGINIYAVHTNLDNAISGVNYTIGQNLGLSELQILRPMEGKLAKLVVFCPNISLDDGTYIPDRVKNAIFEAGAGVIGNYDSCSYNIEGFGTFKALEGADPFIGEKGNIESQNEIRVETIFPLHLKPGILKAMFAAHPYDEVAYDIYPLLNKFTSYGAGMTGELEAPLEEKDFLHKLRDVFKTPVIRHSALTGKSIKKVAFCGGAASFLIKDAIIHEADVFVSSDLKYHDFFEADKKILIADVGHYESEEFCLELLFEYLKKKMNTFAVSKTMVITNPINYF